MLHPAHEFRTHIDTALDRVRDMKPTLDKALADIHALRDILGVPDAPAPVKARPQPGDRVPWADVEDGALYWREWSEMFCMVVVDTLTMVCDHDDKDILRALHGKASQMAAPDMTIKDEAVLVARDLGTDPEAWRKAMREWTANGNKPCAAK